MFDLPFVVNPCKFDILYLYFTVKGGNVMPFMKVIKKSKGMKNKKGDVVLVEEKEIRDGVSITCDGEEIPTENLAPLTKEEEESCLEVQEIPI